MRFGFPFLGFPNKPHSFYNKKYEEDIKPLHTCESVDSSDKDKNYNRDTCTNFDNSFFDVFGIHLYYDDILLISLIFLLYNEGIEDSSLFIALILLLLS